MARRWPISTVIKQPRECLNHRSLRKSFAFMRSIPNHIPLSEKAVRAVGAALMPLAFDRVYSHHFERVMHSGAKQILQSSVERYAAAVDGAYDRAGSKQPTLRRTSALADTMRSIIRHRECSKT